MQPTPNSELSRHIGTISMMASGSDQLSYCAASARNTNITAQREDVVARAADLGLLVGQVGPLVGDAVRQILAGECAHELQRLAGADAGPGRRR